MCFQTTALWDGQSRSLFLDCVFKRAGQLVWTGKMASKACTWTQHASRVHKFYSYRTSSLPLMSRTDLLVSNCSSSLFVKCWMLLPFFFLCCPFHENDVKDHSLLDLNKLICYLGKIIGLIPRPQALARTQGLKCKRKSFGPNNWNYMFRVSNISGICLATSMS